MTRQAQELPKAAVPSGEEHSECSCKYSRLLCLIIRISTGRAMYVESLRVRTDTLQPKVALGERRRVWE